MTHMAAKVLIMQVSRKFSMVLGVCCGINGRTPALTSTLQKTGKLKVVLYVGRYRFELGPLPSSWALTSLGF